MKSKSKGRKPFELPVRYSPRINSKYVRMTDAIAERGHMPPADVLRYAFEAALLEGKIKRKSSDERAAKDSMVTVRTTAWMSKKVEALFRVNRDELQADVLRALLERILPIARDKGMAHVMRLRETALNQRR